MYTDYSPNPDCPSGGQVLVVEGGEDIEEVLAKAPTTEDADGDRIYWIVFADEPRRVWDFTERALRSSIPTAA